MEAKDYLDISFMGQVNKTYCNLSKEKNVVTLVSAEINLKVENSLLTPEQFKILHALTKNTPVLYKEGVFRVESIFHYIGQDWSIVLKGQFEPSDPNGYTTNGWTNDEISPSETIFIDNSIFELDLT